MTIGVSLVVATALDVLESIKKLKSIRRQVMTEFSPGVNIVLGSTPYGVNQMRLRVTFYGKDCILTVPYKCSKVCETYELASFKITQRNYC